MTEPEELEDDLFADLYDGDDAPAKNEEPAVQPDPIPVPHPPIESSTGNNGSSHDSGPQTKDEDMYGNGHSGDTNSGWNRTQGNDGKTNQFTDGPASEEEPPRIGIKEDGKMFIGGLNWETTDQSLKEYFSAFGEVQECTVMRDGASGRSRGFGFLTFKNPRDVNAVMVKEHYLDGKIIDPKRAIPRDEQERTSKIFVGGVSQDATETVFKEYFAQYGRVVDATLMMDKDTGRPRGFGFVTFDSESAVDNTLNGDLTILGKPIEVKKAQPRGNMREDEDVSLGRGGPGGGRTGRGSRNNFNDRDNASTQNNSNNNNSGTQMGGGGGMTPQMMAQYWAKMQQYFATMQQQMAMGQMSSMAGMGGMNPAMMAQMQQMQQMKAVQMVQQQALQQQQQQQQGRGSASPMPDMDGNQQGAGMQAMMQGMNPQMMAQMGMNPAMMAQMQAQMQQQGGMGGMGASGMMGGGGGGSGNGGGGGGGGGGMSPNPSGGPNIVRRSTPGYNAQDQLAFEQLKYEQQQARRAAQEAGMGGGGAPTSWEGMYEDVPPPGGGGGGGGGGNLGGFGRGRGGGFGGGVGGGYRGGGDGGGNRGSQGPQPAPPANAPTGPKNAGKPGANYRGGGHRNGHRGFHPYQRG